MAIVRSFVIVHVTTLMELPRLRIRIIFLKKPNWLEMNIGKIHLEGECPQKDLLMLKDHEGC